MIYRLVNVKTTHKDNPYLSASYSIMFANELIKKIVLFMHHNVLSRIAQLIYQLK